MANTKYGWQTGKNTKTTLSESAQLIAQSLAWFSLEELVAIQECLTGKSVKKGMKKEQCEQLAQLIDFPNQATFDKFFAKLPPYLQKLLYAGCLDPYIDVRCQDWGVEEPLIVEREEPVFYYHHSRYKANPLYRLGLFEIYREHVLHLNEFIAHHFLPFLYKKEEYTPKPLASEPEQVWTIENQIHEVLPLFVESLIPLLKERDATTIVKKGLLKANIKDLRALCGLPPFSLASSYNLDPLVLLAKFILSFESTKLKRPDDGMALIKTMVQRLFYDPSSKGTLAYGSFFEYFALLDHCSLNSNYSYSIDIEPSSRTGVLNVLSDLQGSQAWYAVDDLFQSFLVRGFSMRFENRDVLQSGLSVRGQKVHLSPSDYLTFEDKGFRPVGALRRPLFERPLFKAYLYLLASLGILDIGETTPESLLTKNDKQVPLSPYEALCCVRLTAFGAWCLNLAEERPEPKKQIFETITDTELLLVTFKGKSLERKLFLEQIGTPLGVERYRITEASFIKGCTSSAEVLKRIEKFKQLIDAQPSERWTQFFTSLQRRSTLFAHAEQVLLYTFPDDPEIRRMFATDPALRKLVIRAENNNVVVKKENQKAFQKLLMEHGYLNTL
jgi:hypothetical protein